MIGVIEAVEALKKVTETQELAWQRELGPVLAARDALLALGLESAQGEALDAAAVLIADLEREQKARKAIDDAIDAKVKGLMENLH
jgi:hypothetical protein